MCDCIKDICKRIKNGELSSISKYSRLKIEDVSCDLEGLGFVSSGLRLLIPFTIEHKPIGRKSKTAIHVDADYCPFCGEKILK